MSLDMVNEPERNKTSNSCQGQAAEEALTPEIRAVLGNLALNVQTHTEFGDALAEANRTLGSLLERHPELEGPSRELRAKVAQLQGLHSELAKEVMRYSHAFEDVMVSGPGLDPQKPYWNPQ